MKTAFLMTFLLGYGALAASFDCVEGQGRKSIRVEILDETFALLTEKSDGRVSEETTRYKMYQAPGEPVIAHYSFFMASNRRLEIFQRGDNISGMLFGSRYEINMYTCEKKREKAAE